jgi:hypothetical protein
LYRTAAHRTCSPSALLVEGPDEAGFKVAAALGGHGWFSQEFQEEFQEERCFQGFPHVSTMKIWESSKIFEVALQVVLDDLRRSLVDPWIQKEKNDGFNQGRQRRNLQVSQ